MNSFSFLIEYNEKIQSGEIPAGKELKKQYANLIEDMESSEYRFDLTEAHKRIKFIETKCKHSISPFAGAPFLLELWQKALIEALYGFYMKIDGQWVRRFTHCLLVIARKNGKSTLAAGIGNAEFFCGNIGTNIFCASNDYEQADIVFTEINNMREESRELERVSRKTVRGIFMGNPKQRKKTGKFSARNKAKIKKMSAKTGGKEGRNLDAAIIDETHEMKDERLIAPLEQSASSKDEYLILEITTEGFTDDGHLDKYIATGKKVLAGELEEPRKLFVMYLQDSESEIWQDSNSWFKSNPNLGVSKKKRYLEDGLNTARNDMEKRAFTLAKDFNIKQNTAVAWLALGDIESTETFGLEDFAGGYYIGGVDLAITTDLCCFAALMKKPEDSTTYLHEHFWIPNSKMLDSPDEEDGAKYKEWSEQGWLTVVEGSEVPTSVVADYQYQLFKEYSLKPYKVGYDNRFSKDYITRHTEIFGDGILENVPQDSKCLSNPMSNLGQQMRDHRVNYQNNPVTAWCFRNCGIKLDNMGRARPCKIKRSARIDGVAGVLNSTHIHSAYLSDFKMMIER